jgi:hypothetical protein
MAHAKRQGGDRIEVFRPTMRSDRGDRVTLESDLRRALDRGEIKVLFQPIVRLEDRTIAGFEALLRWDHPRSGGSAAEFIPIAEETGLIVNLGVFALERTARELAAWQRALDVEPPIFASVNVSSRQLLRHDLLHDVKTVLARTNVLPGSLKLELTESLVMENPEYAAQMLPASAISAPASRSTISAPAIRRCPTCSASPSTRSRSTSPSCARTANGSVRSSCARSSRSRTTRHGGRRRGRGVGIRRDRALPDRLRIRPRLRFRRADVGRCRRASSSASASRR